MVLWKTTPGTCGWVAAREYSVSTSRNSMTFADGKIPSFTSTAYGEEHGLNTTMASGGTSPLAWKTTDGRVWFCTYRGVSVLDPRSISINTMPPPVHIEEVTVDQRSFDLSQVAEAAPGRGDVVFRYTGLSFFAPEKVKFKVQA
jgi:hypothetical protein